MDRNFACNERDAPSLGSRTRKPRDNRHQNRPDPARQPYTSDWLGSNDFSRIHLSYMTLYTHSRKRKQSQTVVNLHSPNSIQGVSRTLNYAFSCIEDEVTNFDPHLREY